MDEAAAIRFLMRMDYVQNENAGREVLSNFRRLDMGSDLTLVFSPLEKTKVEPDVVMVFTNSAQMMRLVHGATYHSGTPVDSRFSGRAGTCTDGVIGAFQDNLPKVVVPGNGDRVWGTCQDHEVAMVIPASKLADIVEGLDRSHRKGIRYPIPQYLRYTPEVGLSIPLAEVFKQSDE